jgi:gliding motility-associated-like protein
VKLLKKIATIFVILQTSIVSAASIGGNLTWEYLGNDSYRFHQKIHRNCSPLGNLNSFTPIFGINVWNHPLIWNIQCTLIYVKPVFPDCNSNFQSITCSSADVNTIYEGYYVSDIIYLPGNPPPQGWIFGKYPCCNGILLNLPITPTNTSSIGGWYSTIYTKAGTSFLDDNSPQFTDNGTIYGCAGTTITYNPGLYDPDGDSLVVMFDSLYAAQIIGGPTPVPFTTVSYSFLAPYTWQNQLPNGTINPATGEITFLSTQAGSYGVSVKILSYRNGQLIASVKRVMQFNVLDCSGQINQPPQVTAPFESPPGSGNFIFSDTVYAGELVNFNLPATDTDTFYNGMQQEVFITASGGQFGTGFTDPNAGCSNPPCATLSPASPVSGLVNTNVQFTWQTDCSHLPQGVSSYTYNFVFNVRDDYCPLPAQKVVSVSITVIDKPPVAAPDLRCVSIDATGDITLQWLPPPDTLNSFSNYLIYSGSVIDSTNNLIPGSYTHTNGLQLGSNNYFIETRSGCYGNLTAASNTLQPIIVSAQGGNGIANISWNALHTPPLPSSLPYNVFREYPAGVWSLIGTTTLTNFTDSLNLCGDSVNYRIEQPDQSGCVSISSITSAFIYSNTPPAVITMDSVSVNALGQAIIGWNAGNNYISTVWQYNGSGWDSLTTIIGSGAQSFIHTNSQANTITETYAITVADSCGNMSVISPQQNTLLPQLLADNCLGEINLSWQPYVNLPSSISGYEIWQSINGNLFSQEDFVTNTNYFKDGLNSGDSVCYFIRMSGVNGTTSTSPVVCTTIIKAEEPTIYLRYATVENNNVVIAWASDTIAKGFKIIRKERSNTLIFDTLATVATMQMSFTDASAEINSKSYEYKVIAIDSCGNDRTVSNSAITILLEAEKNDLFSSLIKWNNYGDWPTGVERYIISRNGEEINSLQNNAYIDNYEEAFHLPSPFCYRITAIENTGNPLNFKDYSNSNIVCIEIESHIYVPNAFTPEGINPIFKPVSSFLSHDNYSFAIYNRWGERIFYTTDPQSGWDGTQKGEKSPAGIYIYQLNTDKIKNKKGVVSLVR